MAPVQPAAHQESTLWSWTDLVVFLAFLVLAYLTANFLVVLGYVGLKSMPGGHTLPQDIQNGPILPLTIELLSYGLVLAFLYFLVVAYHRRPFWPSLSWRKPTARQALGYSLAGFLMAVGVQLAPTLLPDKQDFPLEKMFTSPLAAYSVAAFAILVAPFMEELVFRGVLFAVFERRVNLLFAIATTAVLFGAVHVPEYHGAWNHVLLLFVVGGIFSLTRGLTGSLTPSVILHVAYNLSLMAGFFFQTQHFRNFGTP